MLADFFTKPLQGALFRKFRDVILGHKHTNTLMPTPAPSVEERVENQRPSGHETGQQGTTSTSENTGTDEEWQLVTKKKKRMEVWKVTRADTNEVSEDHSHAQVLKNKRCVSRAFSRNNPV